MKLIDQLKQTAEEIEKMEDYFIYPYHLEEDKEASKKYHELKQKLKVLIEQWENGCGKELWCADRNGYIPKCGIDGHKCPSCQAEQSEINNYKRL